MSHSSVNWARFAELIDRHQNYLLTSHVRPDCDALGSELGLAAILESRGKQVRIVNADPMPPHLQFLDSARRVEHFSPERSEQWAGCQAIIILDTSAWIQLGPMADFIRASTATKLVVDHHRSEDDLGAEMFKDVDCEATGRLVVEIADALGVPLDGRMAQPLFSALATDTGWFRFPSARAAAYRTAARLIEAGADPPALYQALYEQGSLEKLRLRGLVLGRIDTQLNGRLASTYVVNDDFPQTGALRTDTDDLVNMALSIRGTEVALIFVEQPEGGFKVSFRSRSQVDCSAIAAEFGGGGHQAAAGATIAGHLEEVQTRVLARLRAEMTGPAANP